MRAESTGERLETLPFKMCRRQTLRSGFALSGHRSSRRGSLSPAQDRLCRTATSRPSYRRACHLREPGDDTHLNINIIHAQPELAQTLDLVLVRQGQGKENVRGFPQCLAPPPGCARGDTATASKFSRFVRAWPFEIPVVHDVTPVRPLRCEAFPMQSHLQNPPPALRV